MLTFGAPVTLVKLLLAALMRQHPPAYVSIPATHAPPARCHPSHAHAPPLLQAYTSPLLDLRFVTSYSNDGTHIACHTFQRRFSRRYLPQRDAAASPRGEPSGAAGAAGGAQDGEEGAEQLGEGALADSERSLGLILGPVDPALKMTAGRAAHGVVQYVQKAHLLTLRGLVCEFVRDGEGHLWFLGPLRAEWASLIPGKLPTRGLRVAITTQHLHVHHVGGRACLQLLLAPAVQPRCCLAPCATTSASLPGRAGRGGEPWANANLMQQPREAKSCASSAAEEVEHQLQRPQESSRPAAAAPLPPAADSPCAAPVPAACDSPSSRLRSKGCKVSPAVAELLDHLPSALQQPSTEQQPGSPRIPAVPAAAASTPGLPAEQGVSPNTAALLASPAPPVMQQEAPTQSPKPAARRGGGGGGHKERLMASSPTATSRGGSLPASPTRVSAGLASSFQLTRELESLRDELLIKTDLADALACKVGAALPRHSCHQHRRLQIKAAGRQPLAPLAYRPHRRAPHLQYTLVHITCGVTPPIHAHVPDGAPLLLRRCRSTRWNTTSM